MKTTKHNSYVGRAVPRGDAIAKIRGTARYIDDYSLPGMLYGATVRSTRQRARIVKITAPALPDGVFYLTARDIPGENYVALFNRDQPLLAAMTVNYVGEPIALLAGPDRDQLLALSGQFQIEYEDLPVIDDLEAALSGESPPIYNTDNIFKSYAYIKGNPEQAFSDSAFELEATYHTGYQEHVYLEPQGMLAWPLERGVKIIGSMQCPFYIQKGITPSLKLNPDDIVVEQTVTGGAFGGKEDFPSMLAGHAALLALKTGKPVKMIYDRGEDILCTTKRHPSRTVHKIAFDSSHKLTGLEIDLVLDGGAHSTLSQVVLARAALAAPGAYRCTNIRLVARAVATNQLPAGAFRGFGAPQAFFPIEMQMNHAAYRLGIDPCTLRKINLLRRGDRTATGQLLKESVGLSKALTAVARRTDFVHKYRSYCQQERPARILKGIGLTTFFHGCGFTGKGEEIIKASATMDYSLAAGARLRLATVDMGQGMITVMRQIAAETLGLPIQEVQVTTPNTAEVPNSGPTVASRTTMIIGGLVYQCCLDLYKAVRAEPSKHDFRQKAEAHLEKDQVISANRVYKVPDDVVWDEDRFIGEAYPIFSWAAAVVEVRVDSLTCEVTVEKVTAAHDIGKAINPVMVEGQIEGGTLQGLGYASLEQLTVSGGHLKQASLTDYIIPTTLDAPLIEPIIIEEPYSRGPYGAKGVGEQPLVGIPAAYVGAVENALRVEFYEIPLTPEIIHRRVHGKRGENKIGG